MGDERWDSRAPHRSDPPSAIPLPVGVPFRVTDEQDGELLPRMYSYWPNAILRGGAIIVFVGHADGAPRFFRVANSAVERLGALVPYRGTAEGWYWHADDGLYVPDGPRLRRLDPFQDGDAVVADLDHYMPGHRLWQCHSSDDGRTHSGTVEQIVSAGAYPRVGTAVFRDGVLQYFPAQGALDESQITPDGRWLVIKEDDDNRVIDLDTGEERRIQDSDGAVGHSDCGPAMLVGEDNVHGGCVRWDLDRPLDADNRRMLFQTWNMGHVSIRGGRCLLSNQFQLGLVDLDQGGLHKLVDHGMIGNGYDFQVKANLDPTGQVACYMSNEGGDRQDVFLLRLP